MNPIIHKFILAAVLSLQTVSAAESSSANEVILIAGAGGTPEFAAEFQRSVSLWQQACTKGQNDLQVIGMVKEDAEVHLMRQATAMVDYAHEEVARVLRVGMSEKQIAGVAEKAMRDAGSEFAWTFTGGQEVASGHRTWTGACTPATDKLVQRGEFVLLDLHGMYGLMLGDVSHNASFTCSGA